MFAALAVVSFGFTVGDQTVNEDSGTVTLQVLVTSGTLQRGVDITYHTEDLASGNVATSKTVHVVCSFATFTN